MTKSYKKISTSLSAIKEDADRASEADEEMIFEDFVKQNKLKKSTKEHDENEKAQNETDIGFDLIFLKKKSIKSNKSLNYPSIYDPGDSLVQKLEKVTTKLYETRNPNIKNLIKDLNVNKSNVDKLKQNLKNEFNLFLDESTSHSSESVKRFANFDKKKDNDASDEPINSFFLTQNETDQTETKLNLDLKEHKNDQIEKPKQKVNTPKEVSKNLELELKKSQEEKSLENMQIALLDEDEPDSLSKESLKKLKSIVDSIKRIDLPKFQPELHQVCQYAGDPLLLKLYSKNVDYDLNKKQNGLGRYCIHECCIKGNLPMLRNLLAFVDDINKLDHNGQNCAHISAKHGELECLKVLIANGIDVKCEDNLGMQPIHLAASHDQPKIIEFLFELGIPLNTRCKTNGKLPIHFAAESGSFEALKLLCEYYVDVSIKDNDENSAAHLAAKNDQLNCLKYLVKLGLPVDKVKNKLGRNVVHMCCLHGANRCLHWLFQNNIDIYAVDDSGNGLAHLCCLGGQAECFNCCIQHDVPLESENHNGETPIDLSRKSGKSNHIEKALRNKITCDECVKTALKIKWEKEHEKTIAEKTIEKNKNKMYNHDHLLREKSIISKNQKSRPISTNLTESFISGSDSARLKRDLVAQYFGPDF